MVAIPLDRPPKPFLELDLGLPTRRLVKLRRVDVLAVDLAGWIALPADFGLDVATREPDDERGDLADGMGPPAARVERLAPDLIAVERVGDREIGAGRILDIEEVAL